MPDLPAATAAERLDTLAHQLWEIADREPQLTGSQRASLLLAVQLISRVRDEGTAAPIANF
jgi:hypothetical protein